MESQGTTALKTREGNETTIAATRRAGNGDSRHDNRDATTTKHTRTRKTRKGRR
jgi:hypothetical protein